MTQQFILDENIVILAQKLENEREEPDTTCRELIDKIVEICHSIVFDLPLWDKYYSQLAQLQQYDPHGARSILRLMYLAAEVAGKLQRYDAGEFPEEADIPQGSQDDVPVVRLAVHTGATLVTTDEALREDLNSCGIQKRYGLRVFSPEEALAQL